MDEKDLEKRAFSIAMERLWQLQREAAKEYHEKIEQAYKEAHNVYVSELSKLRTEQKNRRQS